MSKYFGTDGFRGEANVDLNVEHAYKIGRFLGWYYCRGRKKQENTADGEAQKCKIVVGKDTRLSSYMFECGLSAGITASGADVYLLHVTTTPSVSFIARNEDFDCGIMITASHNAYNDNGIKLINSNGEKMEDEVIDEVEKYLDGDDKYKELPFATGDNIGKVIDYSAGRNRYIGYLISLATQSYKGMRVGLDCSNGSTWMIAQSVFEALGAKVYVINNRPDGTNINMGCGSTHIEGLCEYVKANNLNIGFAFDGDADRCLAVDENGKVIDGDLILYIYARFMQERGKLGSTKVVTTVMSNIGLYKAFDELGIGYEKTDVGDKYVYENMRTNGHRIGGENSGHIIFSKYATTGDGLLTAIKIMQVVLERKTPLSKLASPVSIYPQLMKSVRVRDKDAALSDPDVKAEVAAVERRLGSDGRILVRKSGTEPLIRVMVEAATKELCETNVDSVIAVLDGKGLLVK
jgi:phosphoglucosamine mutase